MLNQSIFLYLPVYLFFSVSVFDFDLVRVDAVHRMSLFSCV